MVDPRVGANLMVVVGATRPEQAKTARELLPHSQFLVPGYGAQGASASDALSGLKMADFGCFGGVVNASRAVLYPSGHPTTLSDWQNDFAANLNLHLKALSQPT
jgi:orotidine-5'-phosphate decarboxylase